MERGAERQRGGDREVVEEKGSVEKQWGDAEVLALVSVWDEVGAQHVAESRATFELISERLRRLSVVRSWWECQAKCRSLGLQSRKPDAAAAANYSAGMDGRPEEGWEEEVEGKQRAVYPSSVTIPRQEGKHRFNTICNADDHNNAQHILGFNPNRDQINKHVELDLAESFDLL